MNDSRNPLLLTLVVLQTATLAFLMLIFFKAPHDAATAPAVVAASGESRVKNPSAAEMAPLLREIVRSEIRAASGSVTNRDEQPAAPVLSEQQLRSQQHAAANSAAVIQSALAAGVWTRADTEALMAHLGSISAEQRLELMEDFYAAINRQELVLKDFPPL